MTYVTATHNGYSYSIVYLDRECTQIAAICDRSGKQKWRRERNVWTNVHVNQAGNVLRQERVLGQDALIAKLERGVCELQSILATTPTPQRNGTKPSGGGYRRPKLNRKAPFANVRDARVE
jgi:hypothetical protein